MIKDCPCNDWFDDKEHAKVYFKLAQKGLFPPYTIFANENINASLLVANQQNTEDPLAESQIIDLFAGTGLVTKLLRTRGFEGKSTLVDKAQSMLAVAKRHVDEEFNHEFMCRNALELASYVGAVRGTHIFASQGAHRITTEEGGLKALLESIRPISGSTHTFSFNLDTSSISIEDRKAVPLLEQKPYEYFVSEILPEAAKQADLDTEDATFYDDLQRQFTRYSSTSVKQIIDEAGFELLYTSVVKGPVPRYNLQEASFAYGCQMMLVKLLDDTDRQDRTNKINEVIQDRLANDKKYHKTWLDQPTVDFYSQHFVVRSKQ